MTIQQRPWTYFRKYGFLLLSLTLTFITVETQLIYRSIHEKKGAEVVNIAGRQRMFSQRLMNLAQQKKYEKAHEVSLKIDKNHQLLLNGGGEKKLPPAYTLKLRKQYINLSSNVEEMKAQTKCLAQKNCSSKTKSKKSLLDTSEDFLPKMDQLVNQTSKYLESRATWNSLLQVLLILSFCGMTILSFFVIAYPQFKKQKEKNKNLQKDKQRSDMLESAAQIGSWSWNPNTDEIHWSQEVYKIHGVQPNTPISRAKGMEFYVEHERPRVQKLLDDVLTQKIRVDGHFEFHAQDGRVKWVRVIAEPILDNAGHIIEVAGVFQDVSEQKLFEKKLVESKKYLELAMEGAYLGIWDWYLSDNSVKFDRRWAEMLGIDFNTIKMELSTWESRVHPEDLPKVYEDIQTYMEGKTDRYQNIHRMKHSEGYWVYILDQGKFSDFNSDGKPTRFTGTHLDITETVRQQERIQQLELKNKESESQTQMILEGAHIGIWRFFPAENHLIWDASMYKIYGVNPNDFEGHFDAWKKTLVPEDTKQAVREFEDFLSGQTPKFNTSFRVMDNKGEIRYIRARAQIFKDSDGNIEQVIGVNWDITAEYQAQKELEQQKNLSQRNARLASIGVLAAGVGHEINNPLSIIKGYMITLKDKQRKGEINEEVLNTYFRKIAVAADRIASIVKGLRTFSRADDKVKKVFNTQRVIKETVDMVNEIYAREGIQISLVGTDDANFKAQGIFGSRGGFQQILMNLLSNARHALKGSHNKSIEVLMAQKKDQQEVTIRDYGSGIQTDLLDRVFDPFFTTKNVNEGTGIGLSMVHSLLEEMGGHIEARNHSAGGAEFIIQIPSQPIHQNHLLATKNDADTSPPLRSRRQHGAYVGKKALVVDDEAELRQILSTLLSLMGIKAKSVGSGAEALELLKENSARYDLVISDIKMPEMDGLELNKRFFGSHSSKSDRPIWILTTGGVNQDLSKLDPSLTVDGYFYKPFDKKDIEEILKKLFSKKPDSFAA